MITRLLTSIILIILFSFSVHADKMRIAIYDFNAKGVPKKTARMVSEWIRTSMAGKGFIILERSQMNKIFKEHGLRMTGCTDSECAVKIGKMLSANKVLVGTLTKWGDRYIIDGRLVDVLGGIAELGQKESITGSKYLDKCADQFVKTNFQDIYRYSQAVFFCFVSSFLLAINSLLESLYFTYPFHSPSFTAPGPKAGRLFIYGTL